MQEGISAEPSTHAAGASPSINFAPSEADTELGELGAAIVAGEFRAEDEAERSPLCGQAL